MGEIRVIFLTPWMFLLSSISGAVGLGQNSSENRAIFGFYLFFSLAYDVIYFTACRVYEIQIRLLFYHRVWIASKVTFRYVYIYMYTFSYIEIVCRDNHCYSFSFSLFSFHSPSSDRHTRQALLKMCIGSPTSQHLPTYSTLSSPSTKGQMRGQSRGHWSVFLSRLYPISRLA